MDRRATPPYFTIAADPRVLVSVGPATCSLASSAACLRAGHRPQRQLPGALRFTVQADGRLQRKRGNRISRTRITAPSLGNALNISVSQNLYVAPRFRPKTARLVIDSKAA